jgi:hypothetical protein
VVYNAGVCWGRYGGGLIMAGVNIKEERFNTIIKERRRNIGKFITRRPVVADLQLLAGAIAGGPGRL